MRKKFKVAKQNTTIISYFKQTIMLVRLFTKECEIINIDNYRCLEATLLHSGYHKVPHRRMMWELQPDCRNDLVAQAIRSNDFDNLFKCLHFADNNHKDDDPYYKVRPIFKNLNRNSKWSVVQSEGKFFYDGSLLWSTWNQTIHIWQTYSLWFSKYGLNVQLMEEAYGFSHTVVAQIRARAECCPRSS